MGIMTRSHKHGRKTLSFTLKSIASTSAFPAGGDQHHDAIQHVGKSTQLADFELVEFIGRGAFGKVYAVNHRTLHIKYALKCISKRRLVQKCMGANVLRELDICERLNHTFIVKLWFTFQDGMYIYIINDLLTGGDLRVHLNEQGRFSESRAKLYLCEIALALDYLHKLGVAHRDIKPENVLLDIRGHAHLSDLNLAIQLNNSPDHLATSFAGTRLYMAPEVILTALCETVGYDHRVDWWSLGICFFEMLHGRRPFEFPASFSSSQVLRLITGNLIMPAHWSSDLRLFISALLNIVPMQRIDCLEKFASHQYMERINMKHVLYRRTAPIFIPKYRNTSVGFRRKRLIDICVEEEEEDSDIRRLRDSSPLSLRMQRHSKNRPIKPVKIPIDLNKTDGSPKVPTRRYSIIGGPIMSTRRSSASWSAELAHLSLSFCEFNRFRTPVTEALNGGQLDALATDVTRKSCSTFSRKSPSGLLLSQSVKGLESTFEARSRSPPHRVEQ